VGEERWAVFTRKQQQRERLMAALGKHANGQWLKRTDASIGEIAPWIEEVLGEPAVRGVATTIETEIKYGGYIQQQERQMERMKGAEGRRIPTDFGFKGIPGLSREVQDKLERVRPGTLGQAGRIPGVTPAAVAVLDCYLSLGRAGVPLGPPE
jgi:tRNA uridine 5-carboxymethylaminomethyl modification enzyme